MVYPIKCFRDIQGSQINRAAREWDVMWDSHLCGRGRCGIRAGELDISPVRGIGNTYTRLHSYG